MTENKQSVLADAGAAQFDRAKHQPPRIDNFGYNKEYKAKIGDDGSNILAQAEQRIPADWGGKHNSI